MLGVVDLYAVSIAGIFALLLVHWASHFAIPYLPCLRSWTLRRIVYPLLIRRLRWTSVTYMEFALLAVYAIVNGVYLALHIPDLDARGTSELIRRSGVMSSVNTFVLFLGGRTNVLIDAFGIPLHAYYRAHHWIGRMAVAQALLHAGLAISSQEWAYDARTVSGLVVALPLIMILLTSLHFVRGILFELFLWAHMLQALTAVGGTIWHILPGEFITLFFPVFSVSVWSITTLCRLARICCNPDGAVVSYNSFSEPGQTDPRLCAIKFTVRVQQHLSADPGRYVYLYFSDLRLRYRFQAHPLMIVWCEYDVEDKDGRKIDITNLTFLVQERGGLTARLGRELHLSDLSSGRSSFGSPVLFDGPYGQDLHLERYETVMLVAKGIGIAGVLPYARHLAQRQRHDGEIKKLLKLVSTPNKDDLREALHRDATRKVDLFWKLDLNRQEEWVSQQLRALQDMDPGRRTNLIYCYYPEEKASEPLIKRDVGWKCIYPGDPELTLDAVMEQEAGKLRRNIVVACGSARFTQSIRRKVLEIPSKNNIIEFAEVEYRPPGFRGEYDAELESAGLLRKRQHAKLTRVPDASEEIELAPLPARKARNALSKAPGMQVMGRVRGK